MNRSHPITHHLLACAILLSASLSPLRAEEEVSLQFPANPIAEVLDFYEMLSGKRIIRDSNLTGPNLSILSPEPLSRREAMELIEATLLLNNYVLIPAGDGTLKFLNVNAGKSPRSEAPPLYLSLDRLPDSEQVVSFFLPLSYLDPQEAQQLLQQYVQLHGYGVMTPVANAQALLITENAATIRKLVQLKELIDVPPARVISEFVELKRADADRVAEMLNTLIEQQQNGARSPGETGVQEPTTEAEATPEGEVAVRIAAGEGVGSALMERSLFVGEVQLLADSRTNRILVITRPVNFPYIKNLIEEFDRAADLTEPLDFPLNYLSAAEVLPVLANLLARPDDEITTVAGTTRPTTEGGATESPRPRTRAGGGGLSRGAGLGQPIDDTAPESIMVGKSTLIADKRANSIMIMGPPESRHKAEMILTRLDQRPKQVYLATVVGTLRVSDDFDFGVDFLQRFEGFSHVGESPGMASSFRTGPTPIVDPTGLGTFEGFAEQLGADFPGPLPLPLGLNVYGAVAQGLDVYVNALERTDRFNILSRPAVFTANNKKAVIASGRKVPVPTQTITTRDSVGLDRSAITSNIQFQDVLLELEVIPLINSNREITLQIRQTNDNVIGFEPVAGSNVPVIGTQEVQTTVTIPDRSTVVLGGLIEKEEGIGTIGIPYLSRIPLLGYLFRQTERTEERRELLVFIQPTIIENNQDLLATSLSEDLRTEIGGMAYEFTESDLVPDLPRHGELPPLPPPASEVQPEAAPTPQLRIDPQSMENSQVDSPRRSPQRLRR